MRNLFLLLLSGLMGLTPLIAQTPDTVFVQTFTFADPSPQGFSAPYRGTFQFPPASESFTKILMYYTLKCDPKTAQDNFDCGEWDYLTYTVVVDSSGVMDSTRKSNPRYAYVTGGSPDSLAYVTSPTYTRYQVPTYQTSYLDTLSLTAGTVGQRVQSGFSALPAAATSSFAQFLYSANELTAAGLSSGDLTGLRLRIDSLGSDLHRLRILLKMTTADSLSLSDGTDGFTEVFRRGVSLTDTGWTSFAFHQPFAWSDTMNLIVALSFDGNQGSADIGVEMDLANATAALTAAGSDRYLDFNGSTDIVNLGLGPQIAGAAPRTIEAWVYTRSFNGGGIFSAGPTGSVGKDFSLRTMGATNQYRVQLWGAPDFDVTLPGAQNAWHHFAVTFDGNVTRLYYDGQQLGQMNYPLNTGNADLRLGIWGGSRFDGSIDEVRVWDKALDAATLAAWQDRSITTSHPDYAHLIGYYPFDEGSGAEVLDQTGQQQPGQLLGMPSWRQLAATDLRLDRNSSAFRPLLALEQGSFTTQVDTLLMTDSLSNHATQLVLYDNPSSPVIIPDDAPQHPRLPTDTVTIWVADRYTYLLDESGQRIDSTYVPATDFRTRNDHVYFSNIVEYEMMRFITPYGINLDLGPEGKTWIFDVTGYAPLLHDHVYLRSGNNQELLDLKFVMIKGTPPREVRKIENLWSGSFSYASLLHDTQGRPVTKVLDPNASMYQVKTRTSGHGFGGPTNCAEFCPRNHYLDINGTRYFDWLVWKECATNHIYPQGGTWVYDRAGWCPGSEVQTFDHELTQDFAPGDSVTFDYAIQHSTPPEGNFVLQGQLFTYGPPTRQLDAEITAILSPNSHDEYSRMNPICANPKIRVRNLGADTLTSIYITYGVREGFSPCYFRWTGSLPFLGTAEIELPLFNWLGLNENDPRFYVELSQVNEDVDEFPANNELEVPFEVAPRWIRNSVLEVRTNLAASENSYQIIRSEDGAVVLDRKNLLPFTTYRDTLNLPDGCYQFRLLDSGPFGQDGLAWWANSDGSGWVRLFGPNGTLERNFEADFGAEIYQEFTMGWTAGKEVPRVTCDANTATADPLDLLPGRLEVFPNPSDGAVSVELSWEQAHSSELLLLDAVGRVLRREQLPARKAHRLQWQLDLPAGMYQLVARHGEEVLVKKLQLR